MNLQIKISYQVSSKKYKKQFHTGTHQTEIKEHQRQKIYVETDLKRLIDMSYLLQ